MNNLPQRIEQEEGSLAGIPRRLSLSNALSTEQQIREMLTEKHKILKKAAPLLEALTGIDQAVRSRVAQAQSERLQIADLALMEQEASQAAKLEPRQAGFRVRMERPIMIALAQEALAEHESMTLHEIMDYLKKNGYPLMSEKTLQGGLIAMSKEPAVFASGLDGQRRKVYRLVKHDDRFNQVAQEYKDWRKKHASVGVLSV